MSERDGIAVRTEGLAKRYGTTEAVSGLDLTVESGQIFGFLGPNGAGKTTTIGVLTTLLRPTAGRAEVTGHDVARHPHRVRRQIGLVFQESTLEGDFTAAENLRFQADLFGVPRRAVPGLIDMLLDLVDLSDRRDTLVRTFSGGMRRRLEIVRGLMHGPRLLFLDEPTTGLDPQTRNAIWEYLIRLRREQGTTVFLTTHHLEEAEHCDRIAIMDRGQLVTQGGPAELKTVVGADLVTLRTGDDALTTRTLRDTFGLEPEHGADGVRLRVADGAAMVPRLCTEIGVPVHSVTVTPPTLDDVFLHHTGRTIRDTDTGPRALTDHVARR
ncbi:MULTISPECIES: daunorubicin resistance protein DrrA family ABC transporter ATP-binding protein [Streptomyces]|uniref:Nodulation ABC transporter NodI n=1 Tax=Streptomyces sviceus (strain ATCC 29083 / DSM 924 / JCM 4929 / NBRC 13980 / NCIMB 11184 / NRRL 5439 / UC 5370) TaxID=463191 RepID=B5I0A5_STRX2|nr:MULTISPECIES: daunorubicin resistance protein DrrA family ABC transporter ATP-binding protein [Streptomyces]EDY58510.1 nodulation ABC transporter NodI [Streptomyces sviceus ATCC 29083]MYT09487.1 daunorubicin resistance protein DrrA family ABC transporter ATP-binding protein [Streptomyces sp. SID5470]